METSVNNKSRAFTSLEQSRKLAEILPPESADMCYTLLYTGASLTGQSEYNDFPCVLPSFAHGSSAIPCWSLASLLGVLDCPQLSKDKLGSGKVGWMVSAYPNDCRYDSCWYNNPIDACYEMILKLNELKIL